MGCVAFLLRYGYTKSGTFPKLYKAWHRIEIYLSQCASSQECCKRIYICKLLLLSHYVNNCLVYISFIYHNKKNLAHISYSNCPVSCGNAAEKAHWLCGRRSSCTRSCLAGAALMRLPPPNYASSHAPSWDCQGRKGSAEKESSPAVKCYNGAQ